MFISHLQSHKKLRSGFTLIEIMTTVGIIGVLAVIAVPAYQGYVSKSRQAEAKQSLAGLYSSENTFSQEYSSYIACLKTIRFTLEGTTQYYTVGFRADLDGGKTGNCGNDGTSSCYGGWYPPGETSGDYLVPPCATDGTTVYNIDNKIPSTYHRIMNELSPFIKQARAAVAAESISTLDASAAFYQANTWANGSAPDQSSLKKSSLDKTTFTAIACGNIEGSDVDCWSINQNRALTHVQ